VSSRASFARPSRELAVSFAGPASISRKKSRGSFASFLQIFTRIRKSFSLSASSASIQLPRRSLKIARAVGRLRCYSLSLATACQIAALTLQTEMSGLRDRVVSRHRPCFRLWDLFGIWSLPRPRLPPLFVLRPQDRRPQSARLRFL
jgi:hypothetical protein